MRNTWAGRGQTTDKIDPKRLAQIRRYGVYALPFIIENVERQNSPELFAAFLIITGKSDLYADYLEHPSSRFASREEKLSLLRSWASGNASKVDKLSGLNESSRHSQTDIVDDPNCVQTFPRANAHQAIEDEKREPFEAELKIRRTVFSRWGRLCQSSSSRHSEKANPTLQTICGANEIHRLQTRLAARANPS